MVLPVIQVVLSGYEWLQVVTAGYECLLLWVVMGHPLWVVWGDLKASNKLLLERKGGGVIKIFGSIILNNL